MFGIIVGVVDTQTKTVLEAIGKLLASLTEESDGDGFVALTATLSARLAQEPHRSVKILNQSLHR